MVCRKQRTFYTTYSLGLWIILGNICCKIKHRLSRFSTWSAQAVDIWVPLKYSAFSNRMVNLLLMLYSPGLAYGYKVLSPVMRWHYDCSNQVISYVNGHSLHWLFCRIFDVTTNISRWQPAIPEQSWRHHRRLKVDGSIYCFSVCQEYHFSIYWKHPFLSFIEALSICNTLNLYLFIFYRCCPSLAAMRPCTEIWMCYRVWPVLTDKQRFLWK